MRGADRRDDSPGTGSDFVLFVLLHQGKRANNKTLLTFRPVVSEQYIMVPPVVVSQALRTHFF